MGAPLVEKLFEGFNGTLFAYGQTGSGKTYSMMGSPADPGVIPKVVGAIFDKCAALSEGVTVTVRASYLQIYREVLQDLGSLKVPAEDLKIRRDPKLGTYVQGRTETLTLALTLPQALALPLPLALPLALTLALTLTLTLGTRRSLIPPSLALISKRPRALTPHCRSL